MQRGIRYARKRHSQRLPVEPCRPRVLEHEPRIIEETVFQTGREDGLACAAVVGADSFGTHPAHVGPECSPPAYHSSQLLSAVMGYEPNAVSCSDARGDYCPAGRRLSAVKCARAMRREDVGDLCAEEPAGSVRPRAAGSHRLNSLPVHRSVPVAWRRGQAASAEPAVHSGYPPEWPAFVLASRSRRRRRSRVIIKGHIRTLRARAGYRPDVATPACRSRLREAFRQALPVAACR